MIYLLNSSMMPVEGNYECRKIDFKAFVEVLKNNEFISYIGYEANAKLLEKQIGIQVHINRTVLNDLKTGDIILSMRLRYRPDFKAKGHIEVSIEDFDFYLTKYTTFPK